MIIAKVYHPSLKLHADKDHPDYVNKFTYSIATYLLNSDESEYCRNNDVVYYDTGGRPEDLYTPLDTFFNAELLEKVKNRSALLAIDTSYESKYEYLQIIYEEIIIKQGIPAEQIYVIGHTLDYKHKIAEYAELYNQPKIGCEFYPLWLRLQQRWFLRDMESLGFNNSNIHQYKTGLDQPNYKKKFICFNSNWMTHRLVLLTLMESKNLIDQGFYSFSDFPARRGLFERKKKEQLLNQKPVLEIQRYGIPTYEYLLKEQTNTVEENFTNWLNEALTDEFTNAKIVEEINKGKIVHAKLPLVLDQPKFDEWMAWFSCRPIIKFYRESYFSAVTETLFLNRHPRHPTEKLFKTIAHKHPFVYCSNPNSLEVLRTYGYKTYDGVINEGYDKEHDDSLRMMMVADEIERLCNLNADELKTFKIEAKKIAEYNFDLFVNQKNWIVRLI